MKYIMVLVSFFIFSITFASPCEFKPKSKFGTIQKFLETFLKQNKEAPRGAHTFIVDTCSHGDSHQHGVYWIDGRSYFTMAWPPASQADFQNFGKKIEFLTNFNKHLYSKSEVNPKDAPVGQYQQEDWAQAFVLSVAKDGFIVHVKK